MTPRVFNLEFFSGFHQGFQAFFELGTVVADPQNRNMAINKKTILMAGIIVVVLGAAAGVWFFLPGMLPDFLKNKETAEAHDVKKEKKPKIEVTADLDTFVVNLASAGRYLRATLSLVLKHDKDKEHLKEFVSPIRHALIMFLSIQQAEELLKPEGKDELRGAIVEQINSVTGREMVENVYFKEFLIQ